MRSLFFRSIVLTVTLALVASFPGIARAQPASGATAGNSNPTLVFSGSVSQVLEPFTPISVERTLDKGSLKITFSVESLGSESYIVVRGSTQDAMGNTAASFSFILSNYSEPLLLQDDGEEISWKAVDGSDPTALTSSSLPVDSAVATVTSANVGLSSKLIDDPNPWPIRFRIPFTRCYVGIATFRDGCVFIMVACFDANGHKTWCRMGMFCPDQKPVVNPCYEVPAPIPPGYHASGSPAKRIAVGTNLRISGSQISARSTSNIRVNPWDSGKVIAGANSIGTSKQGAIFYSKDGGATWGQTYLPLLSGDAFHFYPAVDWTSDCRAWAFTIGSNATGTSMRGLLYVSRDLGATWTFNSAFPGGSQSDKPMIWVDHSDTSPFKDNLYVCWHNGLPQLVSRHTSTGWSTPLQVSGSETIGTALGCDVKTNSAGDVLVFWPATGNRRLLAARSTNGGMSFGVPAVIAPTYGSLDIGIPAFNNRRALIYASGGAYRTATDNLAFASWTDLSGRTGCTSATSEPGANTASGCTTRIWFSRSTDGGSTWSTPSKINDPPNRNDQFNPWMAVDETTGQLAIIYADTIDDPARKQAEIYFQESSDFGLTWSSPIHVTTSPTDETIAGADVGNQYGDYNGLSGTDGNFLVSWTDRRSGGKEEIWTAAASNLCSVTVNCGGGNSISCAGPAGTCKSESGRCVQCGSGSPSFCQGTSGTTCGSSSPTPRCSL